MSTIDAETPSNLMPAEPTPTPRTEPKFTAAQIKTDCPAPLLLIGDEITKRFNEAQKQAKLLDDEVAELKRLIADAKELCDRGGFDAFRERFFPNLGKSRVYELLAIGTNKKSAEQIKAGTRARVAKHRANTAATTVSVTVTEKSQTEAQGTPEVHDEIEGTSIASDQTPEPTKPRSAVAPGDEALVNFSARVMNLVRVTRGKKAKRFAKTSVTADDLARLGELLTDIANLKKPDAVEPMLAALPGTVSSEQSAEDIANAALETSADPVF